jgi:hypothetical protein
MVEELGNHHTIICRADSLSMKTQVLKEYVPIFTCKRDFVF